MPRPPVNSEDCLALWSVANALADAARATTLPYFRRPGLEIDDKDQSRFDPVTAADRAAEDAMRALLETLRPDDAILGEERGSKSGTSGLTWVLDPIDGTRGFMSGTPTWGVLIALSDAKGPFLGIIDQPYIGERFSGGLGLAQVTGPLGRTQLATRPARPLDQAVVFSTFPEIGTKAERSAFQRVAQAARLVRYGMDCYAYGLLAAGQIDLVIEAGLQAYDIQAPIAVIEAAGGLVTNWDGKPAHDGGQIIAAANPQIHEAAMDLLKG